VEVEVAAGVPVVVEGAVADAFSVVVSGELDVTAIGERGVQPVLLRTLGPGTYFGEIGLIGRIPRTATVKAATDCTLLRIEGQDFLEALTNLSASPSLLEGARTRLSLTHPSSTALVEALQAPDSAAAAVAPEENTTTVG
jgi:CRP-like cAMP-binding protein